METNASIVAHLKDLHLPTVRACFESEADLARRNGLSFEQYLLEVLEREMEARRRSRIERYLRESRLPLEKTMASFDRSRLPQKVQAHISLLVEGTFLDRAENVLAFGNPGSGKTHLLCAIANELIHRGRRILFTISSGQETSQNHRFVNQPTGVLDAGECCRRPERDADSRRASSKG